MGGGGIIFSTCPSSVRVHKCDQLAIEFSSCGYFFVVFFIKAVLAWFHDFCMLVCVSSMTVVLFCMQACSSGKKW